jgi:hypothetical protein
MNRRSLLVSPKDSRIFSRKPVIVFSRLDEWYSWLTYLAGLEPKMASKASTGSTCAHSNASGIAAVRLPRKAAIAENEAFSAAARERPVAAQHRLDVHDRHARAGDTRHDSVKRRNFGRRAVCLAFSMEASGP